jgi:hypothetical protein
MGSVFGKDLKEKGTAGSKSNNTSMNSKSNITEKVSKIIVKNKHYDFDNLISNINLSIGQSYIRFKKC